MWFNAIQPLASINEGSAKGSLLLSECKVAKLVAPNSFEIISKGGKKMEFRADSEQEYTSWVRIILYHPYFFFFLLHVIRLRDLIYCLLGLSLHTVGVAARRGYAAARGPSGQESRIGRRYPHVISSGSIAEQVWRCAVRHPACSGGHRGAGESTKHAERFPVSC